MTLHLSRAEVAALMAPGDYVDITAAAFVALADGRVLSPAPMHVPAQGRRVPRQGGHAGGRASRCSASS